MENFKIKDILIEHSNALRALLRASRASDREADNHVNGAVNHMKSMLRLLEKHEPHDVPPGTREQAERAISNLLSGDIDEGRATLLEMGRAFDDFLKK